MEPGSGQTVSVADCERMQAAWFAALALVSGGSTWTDEALTWSWLPASAEQMLLFPAVLKSQAVRRGIDAARARSCRSVGAWLSLDVDAGPLVDAGFERGWSPWWMTARLADVSPDDDPRIALETATPEYDDAAQVAQLALPKSDPTAAWHASARVHGRLAGHAWAYRVGDLAGVFDMAVWPRFRRRGLGTGLLRSVCAAAAWNGARDAVLNATPEGELLYSACGFRRIGEGITYWLHPG